MVFLKSQGVTSPAGLWAETTRAGIAARANNRNGKDRITNSVTVNLAAQEAEAEEVDLCLLNRKPDNHRRRRGVSRERALE